MSVNYKKIRKTLNIPKTYTCDCCNNSFDVEEDVFDVQEMVHINKVCGYNSLIGDGKQISLDICERCLLKIIEQFKIKL